MTVETFDINAASANIVSVSTAAAEHFQKQMDKKHCLGIRLSLKKAGCTGYKYEVNEVEAVPQGDLAIQLENGVPFYVDTQYISAIRGTQIDVRKQGLNLNLVLENPNVEHECGCGESFSIHQ